MNDIAGMLKAMKEAEPKINPELDGLLDTLEPKALEELRKSIEEEGVRDPIIVWKEENVIVDGHNRYRIAQELDKPVKTTYRSFSDISSVKQWMLRNQLGRRNLTPQRVEYYIGKLYNEMKLPTDTFNDKMEGGNTAEVIAKEHGVSERTVRRAGNLATAIDVLERVKGKEEKDKQLSGKGDYTNSDLTAIAQVAKTAPERAPAVIKELDKIKAKKAVAPKPKAAPKPKEEEYDVVFAEPNFAMPIASIDKPNLSKNSLCFIAADDEHIGNAVKLIERWGMEYEGSIVFTNVSAHVSTYTKIEHTFLVIGTRGIVTGPKKNKEPSSIQKSTGVVTDDMIKLIDQFATGKKLDTRKGKKAKGWL